MIFEEDLQKKIMCLATTLRGYGSLVIALSGGIDSVFLLTFARRILKGNLLAVTANSPIHFDQDLKDAKRITKKIGVKHIIFDSHEMFLDSFVFNRRNRCFFCKKNMLKLVCDIALKNGFANVAHGANLDDLNDYRPGFKAASAMGVLAPLIDAGFYKNDIRKVAKFLKVDVWDKASTACVASRFPYGTKIDLKSLEQVKKAELILFNAGFKLFRVRHHGDVARIELDPSDIHLILSLSLRRRIVRSFKNLGYSYISLDLEGYKQGNMNKSILHK